MRLDELFDHVMDYPPLPAAAVTPPVQPTAQTQPVPRETVSGQTTTALPAQQIAARLPGGGGVYLLTDADDRPIQFAAAADLRRALNNRLTQQTPTADGQTVVTSRRRANLREVVRRIRWRTACSQFEITYEYWRIARALHPDSYLKEVGFGATWFVHVDSEAAVPRFEIGKILGGPPGKDLGPFATQTDAARFVQTLEDIFDLCRDDPVLQRAPHGQPCAYFDMGRCPAPCNGSVPMTAYRRTVAEAMAFAAGQRVTVLQCWEQQMREAAGHREFERAAAFRQRIERARTLNQPAFEQVTELDRFSFLIVQRGGGTSRVKPFFVHRGQVEPGEPVRLSMIETVASEWLRQAEKPPADENSRTIASQQELSEQIALVSHFLFKREPAGLFLPAATLPGPASLVKLIRAAFSPKHRPEQTPPPGGP
ncbi:MAG: hypothetical protein KA354_23725 [Phycisphaerae bacterium]|nr:hypothetical protein [Phycisphaerae bacterium]